MPFIVKGMANTALLCSTYLMIRFVTKATPINHIDSKCHIKKLKSSRTCLIGYSGFISHEQYLIAWRWTLGLCENGKTNNKIMNYNNYHDYLYCTIKYFVCEDQRAKLYFVFHKTASVLYGK